jgi:putative ABC transport system permease protein
MFRHYALTLYRSLTRHRLYAALNVLGLAVGIAVFLVLMLDVRFETSFESWIPHAVEIDAIETTAPGFGRPVNFTMGGLLDELHRDFPQLLGTKVWEQPAIVRIGSEVTAEKVEVVDPNIFQVFDLPLLAGDKASALAAPGNVVLGQAMAKRYLAPGDPLGQSINLAFNGVVRTYKVTGILKTLPRNTDLRFDFLVPLTPEMYAGDPTWSHWGSLYLQTYLRFPSRAAARAFAADLDPFIDKYALKDIGPEAHKQFGLRLTPLTALHLLDPKDAVVVAALAAVGLLSLLLAATNYVNLATARAGLRAREVAIRKVMGGTREMLTFQFVCESVLTVLVAALIGLALCEVALPLVNAAGGLSLKLDYADADGVLLTVVLVVLLVGVGVGVYPALLLARFQPAQVLGAVRAPGGGRGAGRVREILVLIQFVIAIAFMIATAVIVAQTRFVRHVDRGYRRDGLIVVNSFDEVTAAQRLNLLSAWRGEAHVTSVTSADIAPGNDDYTDLDKMKRRGAAGEGVSIHYVFTRPDFFTTYGARLIAGRWLDLQHGGDDARPRPEPAPGAATPPPGAVGPWPVRNIVLNASAVSAFGFRSPEDALGQAVEQKTDGGGYQLMTVVGVVEDIRFRSPRAPAPPTIYLMRTADFSTQIAGVRFTGGDPRPVLAEMARAWRLIAPTTPFRAATANESLLPYFRPEEQHARLFSLGAMLAVAIGCVGLYGLASFSTARRIREIGIRKTLGASTADVLRLLVGQFLRPVLLANLVAWPLAWIAMRSWLAGFDQRIALSPFYFLAATALTLAISVATVAGQAFAVARAEPAKALRHE